MARTVAIGIQDFEKIITEDYFYVDKMDFIQEWWESGDSVSSSSSVIPPFLFLFGFVFCF